MKCPRCGEDCCRDSFDTAPPAFGPYICECGWSEPVGPVGYLIATGEDLDKWVAHFGVPPRNILLNENETHVVDTRDGRPLLTDAALRQRFIDFITANTRARR